VDTKNKENEMKVRYLGLLILLMTIGATGCTQSVDTLKAIAFSSGVLLKEQVEANPDISQYKDTIEQALDGLEVAATAAQDYTDMQTILVAEIMKVVNDKIPASYHKYITPLVPPVISALIEQLKSFDQQHPQQALTRKDWAAIVAQIVVGYKTEFNGAA
jgi:hypothetical protein